MKDRDGVGAAWAALVLAMRKCRMEGEHRPDYNGKFCARCGSRLR